MSLKTDADLCHILVIIVSAEELNPSNNRKPVKTLGNISRDQFTFTHLVDAFIQKDDGSNQNQQNSNYANSITSLS